MVTYAIPFGSSLHGPLGAAAKGWVLAGTGNWNTGAWNTITMSANRSGFRATAPWQTTALPANILTGFRASQ